MVISCSAFNCTKRWSKESDLPFHRFPLKHPELLKTWITSVKQKDFNPTSCSFLCGNRFRQDDYVVSPGTWKKRFKPEAVPSVSDTFDAPNKQPRRHVVRILSDNIDSAFERSVMESVLDLPIADTTDCVENVVNENSSVESMSHLSNAEAANCVENLQGTASLPSLNLNASETETQDELILPQCETHQKELYHQQLQNSCTFCADSSSHTCCPEQTVICGKPDAKNQIWQDSKYVAQLLEQVKPVSQVENYAAGEPTDGISTSKSSSSCKTSDICHSSTYSNHSQKNSRGPSYEEASSSNTKWQNGGNKAQAKTAQLLGPHGKHPTGNSICSADKYVQGEDENLRQQNKLFNSKCLHGCVSPVTGSNKQLTAKPGVLVSKSPHEVGCKVMPHQNSKQKSVQSAKAEVGNDANYQGDTRKYDDTARLEILKLRNRIKRYTEGLESPILRKSHTFHAQNPDSPSAKVLKSKTQPIPEYRKDNQSLSCSKSQFQYTKHSPIIQKIAPQMSHVASVKKKRKSSETSDRLLGTRREMGSRTTPSDASSTVSDCQSSESSSDNSNRREPYERNWDIRYPTHLSTNRNVYQKKSGSAKSVPQHAVVKNKVDTAEHCTKQYQGNCPQQTKTVKRNQIRRPVPGQKPLYNYDQLSYQASEVYPDLICELEEKLSAIKSEHADCKSVSPRSKQRLKKK